jgi:hypothetical protein
MKAKYLVSVEESSNYNVSSVGDGSKRIKRQEASEDSAKTILPGERCDCPDVIANGTQCKHERAQDGCFVKEKWTNDGSKGTL